MDGKIKTAKGKVPMALIPLKALFGTARVFAYGAKKYEPGNWRRATVEDGAIERYVGGGLRHLADCQNDDGTWDLAQLARLDDESGLPQLDHLICGLIMLRGIATKAGMPADPGEGNPPPTGIEADIRATGGWAAGMTDDELAQAARYVAAVEQEVETADRTSARQEIVLTPPAQPAGAWPQQLPLYLASERLTPVFPGEVYALPEQPSRALVVVKTEEASDASASGKIVYCIGTGRGWATSCTGNCSSKLFLVEAE